ncbi:hypothetical protein Q9L58_006881 [Maublancomyces gigas]|uniref:non-specific serine/threonine protein kinase n=1 Tax=Discina gigas TaxID=1032678 RepID=A0ABR3GE69_9PEZI
MSSPSTSIPPPAPYSRIYDYAGDRVENLEAYQPGGYFPADIGTTVHGSRYHIVHKLGFGTYSTVWLAKDTISSRLVALKFLRADADPARHEAESRILRLLRPHPCVLELIDEFDVDSANGSHRCLVTEPLGPSLATVKYETPDNCLPQRLTRTVAAQSIAGVAYLHARGVVHGGTFPSPVSLLKHLLILTYLDLHIGNILLALPNLASWSLEQLYSTLGDPDTDRITRNDGLPVTSSAPKFSVRRPDPRALAKLATGTIRIVDFGEAFLEREAPIGRCLQTAVLVAAPEVLFDSRSEVGKGADVWALGCALVEVFGDGRMVQSFFADREEVITDLVKILGGMPRRWAGGEREGTGTGLGERVKWLQVEEWERVVVERMVEGMVKWEPRERVTAAEVESMVPEAWRE